MHSFRTPSPASHYRRHGGSRQPPRSTTPGWPNSMPKRASARPAQPALTPPPPPLAPSPGANPTGKHNSSSGSSTTITTTGVSRHTTTAPPSPDRRRRRRSSSSRSSSSNDAIPSSPARATTSTSSSSAGLVFTCTFCFRLSRSPPRVLGRSARLACAGCAAALLGLAACWVCGAVVRRGDECVSLGWCFWHRACYGCLLCGCRSVAKGVTVGQLFEDGEGGGLGGVGGVAKPTTGRAREVTDIPLCANCAVETELDRCSDRQLVQRGLRTMDLVDGGLGRQRWGAMMQQQQQQRQQEQQQRQMQVQTQEGAEQRRRAQQQQPRQGRAIPQPAPQRAHTASPSMQHRAQQQQHPSNPILGHPSSSNRPNPVVAWRPPSATGNGPRGGGIPHGGANRHPAPDWRDSWAYAYRRRGGRPRGGGGVSPVKESALEGNWDGPADGLGGGGGGGGEGGGGGGGVDDGYRCSGRVAERGAPVCNDVIYVSMSDPFGQPAFRPRPTKPVPLWMRPPLDGLEPMTERGLDAGAGDHSEPETPPHVGDTLMESIAPDCPRRDDSRVRTSSPSSATSTEDDDTARDSGEERTLFCVSPSPPPTPLDGGRFHIAAHCRRSFVSYEPLIRPSSRLDAAAGPDSSSSNNNNNSSNNNNDGANPGTLVSPAAAAHAQPIPRGGAQGSHPLSRPLTFTPPPPPPRCSSALSALSALSARSSSLASSVVSSHYATPPETPMPLTMAQDDEGFASWRTRRRRLSYKQQQRISRAGEGCDAVVAAPEFKVEKGTNESDGVGAVARGGLGAFTEDGGKRQQTTYSEDSITAHQSTATTRATTERSVEPRSPPSTAAGNHSVRFAPPQSTRLARASAHTRSGTSSPPHPPAQSAEYVERYLATTGRRPGPTKPAAAAPTLAVALASSSSSGAGPFSHTVAPALAKRLQPALAGRSSSEEGCCGGVAAGRADRWSSSSAESGVSGGGGVHRARGRGLMAGIDEVDTKDSSAVVGCGGKVKTAVADRESLNADAHGQATKTGAFAAHSTPPSLAGLRRFFGGR